MAQQSSWGQQSRRMVKPTDRTEGLNVRNLTLTLKVSQVNNWGRRSREKNTTSRSYDIAYRWNLKKWYK